MVVIVAQLVLGMPTLDEGVLMVMVVALLVLGTPTSDEGELIGRGHSPTGLGNAHCHDHC